MRPFHPNSTFRKRCRYSTPYYLCRYTSRLLPRQRSWNALSLPQRWNQERSPLSLPRPNSTFRNYHTCNMRYDRLRCRLLLLPRPKSSNEYVSHSLRAYRQPKRLPLSLPPERQRRSSKFFSSYSPLLTQLLISTRCKARYLLNCFFSLPSAKKKGVPLWKNLKFFVKMLCERLYISKYIHIITCHDRNVKLKIVSFYHMIYE